MSVSWYLLSQSCAESCWGSVSPRSVQPEPGLGDLSHAQNMQIEAAQRCVFWWETTNHRRHDTFLIFLMNVMLQKEEGLMTGCNELLSTEKDSVFQHTLHLILSLSHPILSQTAPPNHCSLELVQIHRIEKSYETHIGLTHMVINMSPVGDYGICVYRHTPSLSAFTRLIIKGH